MEKPTSTSLAILTMLCCGAAFAQTGEPTPRPDTTGFYPVWENTGHVEHAGDVHLGTTGAQIGVADVLHVGVQPIDFVYRTPNAYAKVRLFQTRRWTVAAQVSFLRLLDGASRASFSPMYSARIDNPNFAVTLVPVAITASFEVASWLELHQTVTGLGVITSGPLKNTIVPGISAVAEINPHGRHAISFHAADTGVLPHDLGIAGASYRYRNSWAEARVGWFYRFTQAGVQASPLLALGVLL